MKRNTLWATLALVGTAFLLPTASLASTGSGFDLSLPGFDSGPAVSDDDGSYETARRGRGRGRGGDRDDDDRRDSGDDRSDDRKDDGRNDGSSGRDRPRIPGGSGCDDPGDVIEHTECQV